MSEAEDPVSRAILEKTRRVTDPALRLVEVLEEDEALRISRLCDVDLMEVYKAALFLGVYPFRYLRNRDTVSIENQLKLLDSQVAVIGAGGLGGHVIQSLARIGVGRLVVADPDFFDETNLNRQAFSSRNTLNHRKAEAARAAVAAINPAVRMKTYSTGLNISNARGILEGSAVVVDALDNVPDRLALEEAAEIMDIPLVHGAIAGFEGQLTTVFPGDRGLRRLYGEGGVERKDPRSPEAVLGVPSVTPAALASLQTMEVLKILLNRGRTFRHRLVHLGLEGGKWNEFLLVEDP